jgi:hypothetical protein
MDLGCGNGALLAKIHAADPRIQPFGVEAIEEKVAHGRLVLGPLAAGLWVGDLFDVEELGLRRYALTLLMPGRLLEVPEARAERLRAWLAASSERLLVYAYGVWLARFGGLAPLARRAGLELTTEISPGTPVALAGVSGAPSWK